MIYLHIPYCKQKCTYCNFHFSTQLKGIDELLEMIKKELLLRQNELEEKTISSLYFGGGTPSIIGPEAIKGLIGEINKYFDFSSDIEITLEANPDDLTSEFLSEIALSPVNRLSIGTQSFFSKDLELMNRAHSATEAEDSIKRSQDVGLENISIDLIYGSPWSGMDIWVKNIEKTLALGVPHISSYALTVEEKTVLADWIQKGKIGIIQEDLQNEEFAYLSRTLQENGFTHYEISNFAKEGFYSRHNSSYWQARPYLGLGPSAHSYDGKRKRSWNVANNNHYTRDLLEGKLPIEREDLTDFEAYNERIMIGLRTKKGVDVNRLKLDFSLDITTHFDKMARQKESQGLLIQENGFLKIPYKHWFLADGIASDMFLVED